MVGIQELDHRAALRAGTAEVESGGGVHGCDHGARHDGGILRVNCLQRNPALETVAQDTWMQTSKNKTEGARSNLHARALKFTKCFIIISNIKYELVVFFVFCFATFVCVSFQVYNCKTPLYCCSNPSRTPTSTRARSASRA